MVRRVILFQGLGMDSLEKQIRELLAVIHRDGGQHTDAVGLKQSITDAIDRWAELQRDNDYLKGVCAKNAH